MRAWNLLRSLGGNLRSEKAKLRGWRHARRRLHLEALEARQMLAILYVDDNFDITNDVAPAGLSAGDQVTFAPGEFGFEQAGLTFGTNAFSSITAALTPAAINDTVQIGTGTFVTTGQITIVDAGLTIQGTGRESTILKRSGSVAGSEERAVEISANDVTIQNLTLGGWQTAPTNANVGFGYLAWLTNDGNALEPSDGATFDNVRFDGDDNRVALYIGETDNLTVTNSRFTGSFFRAGLRGAGENMTITYNTFEEKHWWYSPIYFEYGGAMSGVISHNYFANRVGANNQVYGAFKEDGSGLYAITNFQPNTVTGAGLTIEYNTFDFQDSTYVNAAGYAPLPVGVFNDPVLTASGPIVIRDNIFRGFDYVNPGSPTALWRHDDFAPIPGNVGSLEFDGLDDYATFQSPLFNVGSKGTLSFWTKMQNTSKRNQFFEGPTEGGLEFQYRNNNTGQFYTRMNTPVNTDVVLQNSNTGTGAAVQNVWTNVQYTWDFATKIARIYLNGTQVAYLGTNDFNIANWTNVVDTVNGLMFMGRDPSDPARYLDGQMDDVAWFNDVLPGGDLNTVRTSGAAALAADSRLVAHWDLDTASGNVELDNKNGIPLNVYIITPTPTEGPTWISTDFAPIPGNTGSLEFDGLNDYAQFQSPLFNVGTAGTLNLWVKANDLTHFNSFVEGPGDSGLEFKYRTNSSGQFYGSPVRGVNPDDFTITAGNQGVGANTDTWLNLQYTWKRLTPTSGEMRIYVNGTEVGYAAAPSDTNLANWANIVNTVNGIMTVGRDPGDSTRMFDGRMDDIGWFNDVLNSTDRNSIRTSGVAALSADARLVAHWDLDSTSGTSELDNKNGIPLVLKIQDGAPSIPSLGHAILTGPGTTVTNNLFYNNDVNFSAGATDGGSNETANPLFAGATNGPLPAQFYALKYGSPALNQGTGFPSLDTRHIGAYQDAPVPPAGTVRVNDDWVGTPFGTDPDGAGPALFFGVDSFATIQEGIDEVDTGGTVIIYTGTYAENVSSATNNVSIVIASDTDAIQAVTINGTLTLDSDDEITFDLNGLVAGTEYDQIIVSGDVALGGATLNRTLGFVPAASDDFQVITSGSANPVSGTFAGLPQAAKFLLSGKTIYVYYNGTFAGDGNDVTLQVNVVPTTSGISDVTVAEDAANTVFSLYPSFADQEDLDPALTYTITSNTNPGLFSAVSINNTTGEFTLDYAADLNSPANGGPATITVRATDTDGDYVETSFVVTVTEVNDAPTGVNDTIPFYIGPGTRTIAHATLLANDIRGPLNENPQTLTLIAVGSALPVGATVSISGSNVLYTPPLGYSGPASFVYTLEDNGTTNGVADPLTSTATANLFFLFPGVAVPQVDLNGPLANFGNAVTYTENTPAVNLTTNTATVTDSDSTYLLSITATLMAAPNGVDEVLSAITTGTSITSSYNSTTRVLTLMGPDTATNFQQVLRTVAYQNLSEDPKTTARTVRFVASDGANLSSFRDATISIVAVADAPSSSGTTTGLTYVENAGNMVVFPDIVTNDPDSSYFLGGSYNYGLTKATISISPYFADQDRLNYTNVGIGGSFNTTTGVFTLNGTQTLAKYNDALRLITYQNLSDNPNTTPRTISVVVFDSTSSSAPLSRVISITSVNDAPLVDLNGPVASGGNHAVTYHTGSGSPLTLAYSTSTLTDADNANLTSLTVTITNPQNGANEVIYYTLPGGISASAPSGTAGTVVFTGSATTATYQTLMRSIQYRNLAGAPTLSPARVVTFAANDGTGTPTAIGTSTATVTLVSPLVASGSPTTIDTTRLTRSQLTSIVTAAITRWSDLGLNAEQLATLRNTSYVIADFGASNLLGTAASGQVITLDDNAAGFGWFVDGSPLVDEEFPIEVSHSERRAPGMTKMDLLTVVMHEMGHILGLPDIDDHDSSGVMTDALDAGTRRLCTEEDLAMLAFYLAQNSSTTNVTSYDADSIRAEVFSRWS